MKPRLYFVNFYYPPLARTRRRYHYARALADAGFAVTVFTIANPSGYFNRFVRDPDNVIDDPEIEVVRLRVPPWWALGEGLYTLGLLACPQANWGWTLRRALAERLRAEPGVVLSLYPPVSSHAGSLRAAREAGCPLVLDFRDEFASLASRGLRRWSRGRMLRIEGELVRAADILSVTTDPVGDTLVERHGIDPEKIVLVYNGIGGGLPEAREHAFDGTLSFVYAGALSGHQAPEIFCDAYRLLRERAPETAARIRMTYYGPETAYARAKLLPRLEPPALAYGGFLPADAAQRAVAEADAAFLSLASPDYAYATPGKLFECIGYGKPILAALPEGAAATIIRRHDVGVVTPAGDAAALAEALETLMRDRDRLRRYSQNAFAARAGLTLEEQVGRLAAAMHARLTLPGGAAGTAWTD